MALSLKRASIFADGLDHPECIAAHPDGSFFAGGEAGQIYRISRDGKRRVTRPAVTLRARRSPCVTGH